MDQVGAIGARTGAGVDDNGRVVMDAVELEWWIGADDGWHVPAEDSTTRHRRLSAAPVFETAVRVPGGDVVQRVFGVATKSGNGAVVVEIENTSRVACSFALVLKARFARLDGATLDLGDERRICLSRRPRLWASGRDVRDVVCSGRARGDTEPVWAGDDVVLLVPGPPRTIFRAVAAMEELDPLDLPSADVVTRGWEQQLDRAMRTELPEPWQSQIDAARADLLLASPSPSVVAALEDWGFDGEAAAIWERLSIRARRAARRRPRIEQVMHGDPATFLLGMRQRLVDEDRRDVTLLPTFPPEWLGQHLAVHEVPLRRGPMSFALRWHGARPALLWDAPKGVTLRAPALDPTWKSSQPVGETLLAAPPSTLLPMGQRRAGPGERIDEPDSFS
jgi:hypothetical protein